MSFSARCVPVILIFTVTVWAQSPAKQTVKTPRGSVSGKVMIKDKPAPGVWVSLHQSDLSNPFSSFLKAVTDQEGVYRITNVPAGSYEVSPSAPAFVLADFNPSARGKSVVVSEDENVDGINFSLIRGGVITGKVIDADGRPAIQQQVHIFRLEDMERQGPQRSVFSFANAMTDDRGIYRMYGVRAGRYKVATGRGDDAFIGRSSTFRTTYQQVFHPDVTDPARATIIEVSEGSEAANVDIKLGAAMQTFNVSGRVVNGENNQPLPNIRFGLQRIAGQRIEFVNSLIVSNEQGEFVIEGLTAGKYAVYLFPLPNSELRAENFTFDVLDQDVSGLSIKLSKGATLSGVIVLENEDQTAWKKVAEMQVHAFVMPPGGGSMGFNQSGSASIAPDGSFRLAGLPAGTANMQIGPANGPSINRGIIITRIERDGVVMPRGVEVKEGEQITGLRVMVSYGNGTIRGVVKLENGTLPPGAQIFVRLTKPGESFSGLRPPQVDERGHFMMEGVPPGDYELSGQVFGTPSRPKATSRVTVQDGIVTDVTVTLDLTPTPKP
jgi:hypothetical protein